MARHLAPFLWRQMIAESVRRRSWGGVLPLGRQVSISGSSRAHCASVSMAPPRSGKAKRLRPQPVQDRTDRSITVAYAFSGVRVVRRLDERAAKPTKQ